MMDLDNLDLLALQPAFLRSDPSTKAICNALQPVFAALDEQIKRLLIYTNIDHLDGPVLDEIAWGFKIAWYRSDDTLAARRDTVKNALRVFTKMGTASAIKNAASAAFGDATVEEWWEYDGDPGCFRVLIEDPTATTTRAEAFLQVIEAVKNVRSHLDQVILMTVSEAPMRIGCVSCISERIRSVQIDG